MPKYIDDQCVRCGGIRVAESTLCVDCLVMFFEAEAAESRAKSEDIKKLTEDLDKSKKIIEGLLDHISAEAIYTMELRCRLLLAEKKEKGESDDGK